MEDIHLAVVEGASDVRNGVLALVGGWQEVCFGSWAGCVGSLGHEAFHPNRPMSYSKLNGRHFPHCWGGQGIFRS